MLIKENTLFGLQSFLVYKLVIAQNLKAFECVTKSGQHIF